MDLSRHGYHNQDVTQQPSQWMAVNTRPSDSDDVPMESPTVASVVVQTTTPTNPSLRPMNNPFRLPAQTATRVILPRPDPIYRTQPRPRACLVCGRSSCTLTSHKHYADQALTRRRSKSSASASGHKGKMPVRPQALSLPLDQSVRYPITMDAERHHLLSLWSQHWSHVRRGPERHLLPVRWIDTILPIALDSAPLFQALLATSASMWALARGPIHEGTSRHLQLADQLLGQTCTTEAIASQDENLLAALLLTVVYQAQGNARETDRRFSSIVQLVEVRRGPYYLGLSGAVSDVLLYVDYLQASILDCEPVWPLPLPPLQIGITTRLGSGFRDLIPTNAFNMDLLLAADTICRTTDIFEQPTGVGTTGSGAVNAFGYLSTVSEYQLAHCNAVFHGSNTWNECICLALLLFNHIVLRNEGSITAPIRKIEHQFWQTVDNTILREGFRDVPPCLLLWLFMTGLSPSTLTDRQYRFIAVKRMRAAKISAAITGWDHFQHKALEEFVWLRAAQEETFRDVWLEVEGYRIVP